MAPNFTDPSVATLISNHPWAKERFWPKSQRVSGPSEMGQIEIGPSEIGQNEIASK